MELPNLIENLALEIFVNGSYEKDLVDYLVAALPANSSFVDVGANIGAISLFVAKRRPDVTVFSIEASGVLIGYLQRNIALTNVKNVRVVHKAIYSVDEINLDFYAPAEKFGKGSLAPVFTKQKE